jgi:5-carboxymethyl-2-hydroxymuconate isomerase
MPHLVILYTPQIEAETDMSVLCRSLADVMLAQRDEGVKRVFPIGGTRVLAYPAAHYAVADGAADYAFIYLNLRMGAGRSEAVKKSAGDELLACASAHFEALLAKRHLGITLQIDEGLPAYDGKLSNLHPLFNR